MIFSNSTVVKQLANNPKIKGSNPAPGYRRDKIAKECFFVDGQ